MDKSQDITMLLSTVNNSIGDKSQHFTTNKLLELFAKKSSHYSSIEKYAVETIQTEATKEEISFFQSKFKINPKDIEYLLSCNPY